MAIAFALFTTTAAFAQDEITCDNFNAYLDAQGEKADAFKKRIFSFPMEEVQANMTPAERAAGQQHMTEFMGSLVLLIGIVNALDDDTECTPEIVDQLRIHMDAIVHSISSAAAIVEAVVNRSQ